MFDFINDISVQKLGQRHFMDVMMENFLLGTLQTREFLFDDNVCENSSFQKTEVLS